MDLLNKSIMSEETNGYVSRRSFNPHLHKLPSDNLHHIGYSRDEIKDIFHDVKVMLLYIETLFFELETRNYNNN